MCQAVYSSFPAVDDAAPVIKRRRGIDAETLKESYLAIGAYLRACNNKAWADSLRRETKLAGSQFPGFLRGTRLRRASRRIKHLEPSARGRQVHLYTVTPAFRRRFEEITGEAY